MSLSAAQVSMRAAGIGSSEIATVLGLSDAYGNLHDLFDEKTSPGSVYRENALHLRVGAHMEEFIARLYEERTGHRVVSFYDERGESMPWTIAHPKESWMLASPDRFVGRDIPYVEPITNALANPDAFNRLLEIKHVTFTRDEWGDGIDEVPPRYLVQCQWQMGVSGVHRCDLVALLGDLKIYPLEFDTVMFAAMAAAAREFWFYNVLGLVPPEIDHAAGPALLRRHPMVRDEDLPPATEDIDEAAAELFEAKTERAKLDKIVDELENRLKAFIGDRAGVVGYCGEHWRARWANRKGSTSWRKVVDAIVADPSQLALGIDRLAEQFRGAPTRAFDFDKFTPKESRK